MKTMWKILIPVILVLTAAACTSRPAKPSASVDDGGDITDGGPHDIDGGAHDEKISGYSDTINSVNITRFFFEKDGDYSLECLKEDDGTVWIHASGGSQSERDGSTFVLNYETEDTLLKDLQNIVEKHHLSTDNGHAVHIDGIPACDGETLHVVYESGEAIYRADNSGPILEEAVSEEIRETFRKDAQAHGHDFTTEGSTEIIHDDADEEFLQGTWTGTHFGKECRVIFTGNHVQIFIDNKLIDDCSYVILDGAVVPDNDESYPNFTELSRMRKANDSTLTAYFLKPAYSTADLHRQAD